jgi:hypothetical protein
MTTHLPGISEYQKPGLRSLKGTYRRVACKVTTTMGCPPLPIAKKVLMFLWYMGNQNCFREISDKFNVSSSSAHRAILQVLTIMSTLGWAFVSWPKGCEKRVSATSFQRTCGLERVIGAIDGCHIRIQCPRVRGVDYMNRKSFYSVLPLGDCGC